MIRRSHLAAVVEEVEARRLLNGGERDLSFGTSGRVTPADLSNTGSYHVVQLSDGKMLIAGRPYVARLLADGQMDVSYGVDGLSAIPTGLNLTTAVPGNDGTYYALSAANVPNSIGARVDRYLSTGQPDLAFGNGSGFITCATGWEAFTPRLMRVLADGSFLFGGNAVGLIKVSPSGITTSLDAEIFGSATDVIELPDGDLLVAYLYGGSSVTRPRPAVVRINADGTLDSSFVRTIINEEDAQSANNMTLVQQSNGRILLTCSWAFDTAIVAIQPNGGRDTQWGNNGVVVYPFAPSAEAVAETIVGQDDSITFNMSGIFAGSGPNPADVMLVHLNADGERDVLFGTNGVARLVTPGIERAVDLLQQADGKLVFLHFPNSAGGDLIRFTAPVTASPISLSQTGQLQIMGTSGADIVGIEESGTKFAVNLDGTIALVSQAAVTSVLLAAGGGDDQISLGFIPNVPITINGGSGLDTLHIPRSGPGGLSQIESQSSQGTFTYANGAQVSHVAVESVDTGSAFPFLTQAHFDIETHVALQLQFNLDLGASLTIDDVILRNLDTGEAQMLTPDSLSVSMTFDCRTAAQLEMATNMPNAHWQVEIAAGALISGAGIANECVHQVRFTYSQGDTNGDGLTTFGDLFTVMQRFGRAAIGRSQGDVNYDGRVGFDDLLAVAQSYEQSSRSSQTQIVVVPPVSQREKRRSIPWSI